ncbi:chaperone protein dnaJ C76, chloroplastic-like [Magnolia sinica]|uniref:chaperone protein dnaJ C76, chloroplastic-like n=1 Tax=Magnolia sinica TaxID=86752 RepID=UPI00265A56FA|nr:chaperone protein dnaJ C76, chloroplastic-like [Magnolia sinica]
MPSSGLLLYNLSPSSTIIRPSKSNNFSFYSPKRRLHCNSVRSNGGGSSLLDYDLYDLLGVDSSSNQAEIKNAYRSLQKRCHPDIAGPTGHDMAIILNEAYSVLSDPNSRSVYDREQAKMEEFRGYTGKPVYSMWFGSEKEERAVFVDEVKCVGCLKCALFAQKTFAIESVYGRARVVAQWADPEHKINDAIQSCPVDCISIVERSNLAALEFLMSKQPRGNVRMSSGNAVGTRVSNIFVDVNKFQSRFHEMKEKANKRESEEPDLQKEARNSAMQTIRSISNWWYWQTPTSANPTSETRRNLIQIAEKSTQPDTERLREAVAKRRARENSPPTNQNPLNYRPGDDYWTPTHILPPPTHRSESKTSNSPPTRLKVKEETAGAVISKKWRNPMSSWIPIAMALVSEFIVGFNGGDRTAGPGLKEHVGGSMVLEIINSPWLQVILAGLTWYLIGAAMVGAVQVLQSESGGAEEQKER